MIIPALVRLYDRMLADGDEALAPPGYSRQQIGFKVVLERDGTLFDIVPEAVEVLEAPRGGSFSARSASKRAPAAPKARAKKMLVPGQGKPSGSGINPCFLWDNAAYMLALPPDGREEAWAAARFEAFRVRHFSLKDQINDPAFDAVCAFLKRWTPARAAQRKGLREIATNFGVFQVRGQHGYVHERPNVERCWKLLTLGPATVVQSELDLPTHSMELAKPRGRRSGKGAANSALPEGPPLVPSLVDGRSQILARLHEPKIKNLSGAQASGAAIVSFNQPSFTSFGKDQGVNAPVGVEDAFKYCTALNRLTGDDTRRVRLAGDTIVFWSEGAPDAERFVHDFMGSPVPERDPSERARETFERARQGLPDRPLGDPSTPFYILGLAPNMARVSVRLWHSCTVGEIVAQLRQHLQDLAIEPMPPDAPPQTISRLIGETVMPGSKPGFPDTERLSPNLAASMIRAVLTGAPYPSGLLAAVIARCRVEGLADASSRRDWRDAQHRRCALIRACLVRTARTRGLIKEVPVSHDPSHESTAYQLGRLFAILERCQEHAIGRDVNATIKDRFFGSAMTTPAVVFPRLLKLNVHHLRAIDIPGLKINLDKELSDAISRLTSYPRTLSLEDQGLFSIGYYHQRQTYFTKKEAPAAV